MGVIKPFDFLVRRRLSYTWAARGGEGFPEDIPKVFPPGTGGRILAIIIVHHKTLSLFVLTSMYLFLSSLVYSAY